MPLISPERVADVVDPDARSPIAAAPSYRPEPRLAGVAGALLGTTAGVGGFSGADGVATAFGIACALTNLASARISDNLGRLDLLYRKLPCEHSGLHLA